MTNPLHMPTPNLLPTASVCDEYGCDRSTLSRWVAEGFISPAMRLPGPTGPLLFDPAEVARVKEAALRRLSARRGGNVEDGAA